MILNVSFAALATVVSYFALLSAFSLVIISGEKKKSVVPSSLHSHGTDK